METKNLVGRMHYDRDASELVCSAFPASARHAHLLASDKPEAPRRSTCSCYRIACELVFWPRQPVVSMRWCSLAASAKHAAEVRCRVCLQSSGWASSQSGSQRPPRTAHLGRASSSVDVLVILTNEEWDDGAPRANTVRPSRAVAAAAAG